MIYTDKKTVLKEESKHVLFSVDMLISNQLFMGCHTSIASIMRDQLGCRCFVEELSHMRKDVTEMFDDKIQ